MVQLGSSNSKSFMRPLARRNLGLELSEGSSEARIIDFPGGSLTWLLERAFTSLLLELQEKRSPW